MNEHLMRIYISQFLFLGNVETCNMIVDMQHGINKKTKQKKTGNLVREVKLIIMNLLLKKKKKKD